MAELPEVLRIAAEMYARDKAQIERAARRVELERAAAEAGLPPEYLERAAAQLCGQRVAEKRRRKRWRLWAALGALVLLVTGARIATQPSAGPPPEAYMSALGGPPGYPAPDGPYGGPGGPYSGPSGYGSAAAPAAGPPGYPGPPGGPPGYPGGPPVTSFGYGPPRAGANLRGAPLSHANLAGQILSRANLRGAVLTNANLRGADLKGCDLRGADMRGADLAGSELDGAIYDKFTRWPGDLDPRELGARPVEGVSPGRARVRL
jgi:hypothetical protein